MKLYRDKLAEHIRRGLAPVYLLTGNEPLSIMECRDILRKAALEAGYDERVMIAINDDNDWAQLQNSADSLSLFASRRLLEVRLPTGKPGRLGAEVLKAYASSPPADVILLISTDKYERSQANTAWFKAIDKVGVTMTFWPVQGKELLGWIESRMASLQLQTTRAAVQMIAERVEGNMLAAAQEVERLSLLYPEQKIDTAQVLAAVANSARYAIGDCVDAAMQGASVRAITVLAGLKEESVSPVLVLWSLTQEIRSGTRVAQSLAAGMSLAGSLKAAKVWQNRVAPLQLALSRHTEISWISLLRLTSVADRILKGHATGDSWEVLADVCVRLSGDGKPVICAPT